MIQPDFCPVPMLCVGCDTETDSAIWFNPTNGSRPVVLCAPCCALLLDKASRHPQRRCLPTLKELIENSAHLP